MNAGWVPKKMRGHGAPDALELGHRTQALLASGGAPEASATGGEWDYGPRREPARGGHGEAGHGEPLRGLGAGTGDTPRKGAGRRFGEQGGGRAARAPPSPGGPSSACSSRRP